MATGKIIKQKREEMGITQEDLALACGISQGAVTAIECGRKNPSLPLAKQIATVLGCTVDELCQEVHMAERDYYDKYDIMNIFGCGVDRAMAILRSIKNYTGDVLGLKGKVLVTEYEAWKNRPLQKNA